MSFRAEVLHLTESRPGERVKNVFILIGAERIGELAPHLAFYAGWPNAVTAISVAREVFQEN